MKSLTVKKKFYCVMNLCAFSEARPLISEIDTNTSRPRFASSTMNVLPSRRNASTENRLLLTTARR